MWKDNDQFGLYEGECVGCDTVGRVDDLGLCEECASKLERDLIRQRDWAYSVTAFGLSDVEREDLRRRIMRAFGEDLELISPPQHGKAKKKGQLS